MDLVRRDTPQINPVIANGLAVSHMKKVEEYVDGVARAVSKDFPQGLQYVGCQRCTPQEEYNFVTMRKNNKRSFDIARSDVYLMKYYFKFKGEDLPPRYIYLPFVSDAGIIILGGSRFVISPVLSDKVISLGKTNVFIRLLRDRLTFERTPHNIIINDRRETVQVVWSLIYHKPANIKNVKPTTKANCSLMHYLLCKYGFTETFRKFAGCVPIVGTSEINEADYPESDWVICKTSTIKPKTNTDYVYTPNEIKLVFKKDDFTPMVKSMVAGFFYVVDHFPQRIATSYLDNTRLWIILLGHILFTGHFGEGKLFKDVSEHFESLDEYIDSIIGEKLKDIGYEAHDVYELFGIIIKNFNDWLIKAKDEINSMYGKELSILYFVLMGITSSMFKLHFKLKKAAAKKQLTDKDITTMMNMNLKPGVIYSITNQHSGVSTVSYSGDNKYFEITSILVAQKSSNKASSGNDKQNITDEAKRLHVSVAEVGGYLNITKSEPSGRSQINPHVKIDEKANVLRDPSKIALLDRVQEMIKRD